MDYLGHIVSGQGVSVDPSKIQSVWKWPIPKTLKALRGFLGLAGYYRKFIRGYNTITTFLSALTKNSFVWSDEAKQAFKALKEVLTSPPVLALPDFNSPFTIECDASDFRTGAVLLQKDHPIAFISQELKSSGKASSAYEREMMSILLATKKWRQYLLGKEFIIKTDHKPLKFLLDQRLHTEAQHTWLLKLANYWFTVEYKRARKMLQQTDY